MSQKRTAALLRIVALRFRKSAKSFGQIKRFVGGMEMVHECCQVQCQTEE